MLVAVTGATGHIGANLVRSLAARGIRPRVLVHQRSRAALEGIARNPGAAKQVNGPMILGLALIESLVIYALIIAILLWLKIS